MDKIAEFLLGILCGGFILSFCIVRAGSAVGLQVVASGKPIEYKNVRYVCKPVEAQKWVKL